MRPLSPPCDKPRRGRADLRILVASGLFDQAHGMERAYGSQRAEASEVLIGFLYLEGRNRTGCRDPHFSVFIRQHVQY